MQAATGGRPAEADHPAGLRLVQLGWLAGAVFIVSAGYGALLPVLPGWLASMMPGASASEVGRHVGFLSGVYAVGVLVGAPLWGIVSDRVGRGRILIIGLVGYVASSLLLLIPSITGESGTTMGGLAAAAGLGQTLGSAAGGWLFSALAQLSFAWLTVPLLAMLLILLARPLWWSGNTANFSRRVTRQHGARPLQTGEGHCSTFSNQANHER